MIVIVWKLDLQLTMHSVPITTNVVSSVGDLQRVCSFLWVLQFSPPKSLPPRYNWKIVESGIKHHNSNPFCCVQTKLRLNLPTYFHSVCKMIEIGIPTMFWTKDRKWISKLPKEVNRYTPSNNCQQNTNMLFLWN